MVTHSRQTWAVGSVVRVGFLTLTILDIIPTPGDYRPDIYLLADGKGRRYEFTPHFGLSRV
jgi:hypothetical protein